MDLMLQMWLLLVFLVIFYKKWPHVWNGIARNYVDRFLWYIWQKYSKDSRIEFACYGFHVGLLVTTISSLKLHTENNVCMRCVLQAAVERAFSCSIWDADLCEKSAKLTNRWTPSLREISVTGGSEVCLADSATATQLCQRFHQYARCVCRCSDACRLFRTSPAK